MMDEAQALVRAARCAKKAATALCWTLGLCLAAGSGRGAEGGAWNIELSRTIPLPSQVVGVAWSPDGKRLASMQDFGREISIWTADGVSVTTFSRHEGEGPQGGQCLAFLPDGKTLLAPALTDTPEHRKSAFGLWDTETGALERLIPGPNPDSDDSKLPLDNSAGICALSPNGALAAMRPRYPISAVAVYSTRDWHILGFRKLWHRDVPIRWPDMRLLPELQNSPSALSFGADDALSVGAMRAIVTFDAPFGSREPNYIAEIPPGDLKRVGPTPEAIDGPWLPTFRTIKYSPGGSRLAIGIDLLSRNYYIGEATGDVERLRELASLKIWDVRAQSVAAEDPMPDDVPRDVDWNRDGTLLAVVTQNHFLKIYRPAETGGKAILQVHLDGSAASVKFSPTADQVVVDPGNTVQMYTISQR
jgi:WD40 repeat protein